MSLFDKAKLFYKENQKLAVGIAVAATLAFVVLAYFGKAEAQTPGYAVGTPAFCTSSDIVKKGFSAETKEAADAFFTQATMVGVCVGTGYPVEVHIVEVLETFNSPFAGTAVLVKMLVDGYESEGFVFWATGEETAERAREMLRGV